MVYMASSGSVVLLICLVMKLSHKPLALIVPVAFVIGILLPNIIVKMKGEKRIKKFLSLFPDAIDFIVRGLRSGLPVTSL